MEWVNLQSYRAVGECMLEVSKIFMDAINRPGRMLRSKMVFKDVIIQGETIKDFNLEDSILTNDSFEIGTFVSTSGTANLINTNYKFAGKEFSLFLGVQITSGVIEYLKLGVFKVESCTIKESVASIKFFDKSISFDSEYKTKLEYPATLKQVVKDVCSTLGITLKTQYFINSEYIVKIKPNFDDGLTYRKVISQVAELAGGYARLNSNGDLEFFNLPKMGDSSFYVGESTYTAETDDRFIDNSCVIGVDRNTYIDLDTSESVTETITKLVVKTGEVKAELGENSGATYFIENNIFCQNPVNLINSLFDILYGVDYRKLTVKWIGNPVWQCGDLLTVYDGYKLNNTYIMGKKLNFNGGLTEEYTATGKTKEESEGNTKGNITLKVDKTLVEIKIAKDEISQRVKKDDFESYVKQTALEISSKVTADEAVSAIVQKADSVKISIDGKLKGTNYEFTGKGFKIGDSTTDVAELTPQYGKWKNSDGSFTVIDANGLYHENGSTKRSMHYLNYSTSLSKIGNMTPKAGYAYTYTETVYLDMPDEFKNKSVNVNVNLEYLYFNYTSLEGAKAHYADIENNRIKVYVFFTIHMLVFDANNVLSLGSANGDNVTVEYIIKIRLTA